MILRFKATGVLFASQVNIVIFRATPLNLKPFFQFIKLALIEDSTLQVPASVEKNIISFPLVYGN